MVESELQDDLAIEEAPRRRGGMPRWLWIGCGCGCAFLLAVVLALVIGSVLAFKRGADPEQQWPRLAEVLAFEERPEGLELEFGFAIPYLMQQFVLTSEEHDLWVTLIHFRQENPEEIESMLSEDPPGTPFGWGEPVGGESVELELQGRAVRGLRFSGIEGPGDDELGPGIRLDLSEPGRLLMAEVRRQGEEPPTEEEIAELFAPFDLWSAR